jgi:regulatory protein
MASKRAVPEVSPEALEKAALTYLERYASSVENLRRVLLRRIERAARAVAPEQAAAERRQGRARVDEVVAVLRARRLLDDSAYAEARVRSLSRQGRSRAGIAQRLATKGVEAGAVQDALAGLAAEGETDLAAAARFAKRRRLGPFRAAAERSTRRARDLAALGRAGFSFEIARRVVDAASPEALAALLEPG